MICSRMKFVEGTRSGQCNCPLQRIVSEPYWRRLELEEGFEKAVDEMGLMEKVWWISRAWTWKLDYRIQQGDMKAT